jgi:hypothetical protein
MDNTQQIDSTLWMSGHYGLMVHWIYPSIMPEKGTVAKTLDEAVNHFNLQRFLQDFAATGADWLIFTSGQNSGYYASPNSVIEQLAGKGHCSERDLMLEIANGVRDLGKRFIAYLPCEVAGNVALHQGFAWSTQEGTNQAEFQRRYLAVMAGGSMAAMNGRSSTAAIWIGRHGMKPHALATPTGWSHSMMAAYVMA